MSREVTRCKWVNKNPLYIEYHDNEWGVPIYNDQKIFEFLLLETFQAGLSWIIILKKRENFREAFDCLPCLQDPLCWHFFQECRVRKNQLWRVAGWV